MLTILACLVVGGAIGSAGCTTRQVVPAAPRDLIGASLTAELASGESVEVRVEPSPSGTILRTASGAILPQARVRTLVQVSRSKGAGQGFAIGAAVAGTLGVVLGLATADDDECGGGTEGDGNGPGVFCLDTAAEEKAVVLGAGMGLIGGTVGLVLGTVAGASDRYRIDPQAR